MPVHRDILAEQDSLKKPLIGSVVFHGVLFASLALYSTQFGAAKVLWGNPNALGGGSVAITPVSQIPMPPRGGFINPVANDTESNVPAPPKPKPQPKQAPAPAEDAIAIKQRTPAKKTGQQTAHQRQRPTQQPARTHQLYSSSGAAVSSPMYGSTSGGGGVGVGTGSPFGHRYGYYEEILRQRVASKWRTAEVDPTLRTAPPVIVSFEIQRDGRVRDVRFLQRSGNSTLDYSAQRAILEASPFPPLPAGFERNSAAVEFWFQLER